MTQTQTTPRCQDRIHLRAFPPAPRSQRRPQHPSSVLGPEGGFSRRRRAAVASLQVDGDLGSDLRPGVDHARPASLATRAAAGQRDRSREHAIACQQLRRAHPAGARCALARHAASAEIAEHLADGRKEPSLAPRARAQRGTRGQPSGVARRTSRSHDQRRQALATRTARTPSAGRPCLSLLPWIE